MLKTRVLLFSIIFQFSASAESFHYFDGRDIDYWHEGKMVKDDFLEELGFTNNNQATKEKQKSFSGSTAIRGKDNEKFNWKNYKDPKNPEFWDDGGDWIPPRPFREAVANPTPENIDAYMNWIKTKTAMLDRFNVALKTYVHGHTIEPQVQIEKTSLNQNLSQRNISIDWRQFQVAYFYQTSCPHCQKSIPVVRRLQNLGAKMTYIQLDSRKYEPTFPNSIPYTKELDEKFHVNSTPTWFIKYRNSFTSLGGERSLEELTRAGLALKNKGGL